MGFQSFCTQAFDALERNLAGRREVLFWDAGEAIPELKVIEKSATNGHWYASGTVATGKSSDPVEMSIVLTPGELRVGILVPKRLLNMKQIEDDIIAMSPDGKSPDITRETVGGYLFDRCYEGDPFTASWIVSAYTDPDRAEAVVLAMATLVANTWKSAFSVIMQNLKSGLDNHLLLISSEPLPLLAIKRAVPLVVTDHYHNAILGHTAMARSSHSPDAIYGMLRAAGISDVSVMSHQEVVTVGRSASDREPEVETSGE
jgi:hypothetical protein